MLLPLEVRLFWVGGEGQCWAISWLPEKNQPWSQRIRLLSRKPVPRSFQAAWGWKPSVVGTFWDGAANLLVSLAGRPTVVGECSPYPELPGGKEGQGSEEDKGVRMGVDAASTQGCDKGGADGRIQPSWSCVFLQLPSNVQLEEGWEQEEKEIVMGWGDQDPIERDNSWSFFWRFYLGKRSQFFKVLLFTISFWVQGTVLSAWNLFRYFMLKARGPQPLGSNAWWSEVELM